MAAGNEQHRRKQRGDDKQTDKEEKRPREGERPAASAGTAGQHADEPENEDQRDGERQKHGDDDIAFEQPRIARPDGIGERAREPVVRLFGCRVSHRFGLGEDVVKHRVVERGTPGHIM